MGCSSTFSVKNLQKPASKLAEKIAEKTKNPAENLC
jgi:hypothetical protein